MLRGISRRSLIESLESRVLLSTYYVSLAGTGNGSGTIDKPFSGVGRLNAPRTAVAAWVLCAPSDEEAQYLAASSRMTPALW